MRIIRWHGCYDSGWGELITSESFAHPAKMARGLLERILEHGFKEGWWARGDLIGDCFGGVGNTGLLAAYRGLRCVSVELEPRFVGFAQDNYRMHAHRLTALGCPQPVIIQGDSRRFDEIVGEHLAGVVASPPFVDCGANLGDVGPTAGRRQEISQRSEKRDDAYGTTPGQIGSLKAGEVGAVISSPPFQATSGGASGSLGKDTPLGKRHWQGAGAERTPGNIETLPPGNLSAVVSSPPYADTIGNANHIDYSKAKDPTTSHKGSAARDSLGGDYGQTPGQISRLPSGKLDACVSSPPFEDQGACADPKYRTNRKTSGGPIYHDYGTAAGQIGQDKGETYWAAVKAVYQACHRAIKPGGILVLVVKNYVKGGKIVPLTDDTVTLCESLGFTCIERIQAMLTQETRHADLFEGHTTTKRERKSFFRRLAEKRGSPPIDFEEVLVFRKS